MKKILRVIPVLLLLSITLLPAAEAGGGKIFVLYPKHLFEGVPLQLEVKGVNAARYRWDFGDGTVTAGGRKISHTFRRSGVFKVKVSDRAEPGAVLAEERISIIRDNRHIRVPTGPVMAGMAVKLEARECIDASLVWNYGDGTRDQRGGHSVSYTYQRPGRYKIKVIDFAGKGLKNIVGKIHVIEDRRTLEVPDGILAGEPAALNLKNTAGGDFKWMFSDHTSANGTAVRSKIFSKPGKNSVTITDRSGLYPAMTVAFMVHKDDRGIKGSADFALPKEELSFTALRFRDKRIKWDFGDGTVTSSAPASVTHSYDRTGRFKVSAVDFNGKSKRVFTCEVKVAELSPGFNLRFVEIAFDNGKYYRVVGRNQPPPRYFVKLKGLGRGILRGKWLVDGAAMGYFQVMMEPGRISRLERREVLQLPVLDLGKHSLTLEFVNYHSNMKLPFLRYFVAETGEIELLEPGQGSKIRDAGRVLLKWRLKRWMPRRGFPSGKVDDQDYPYEIAVSETPFQFLGDQQVEWKRIGPKPEYELETRGFKNWVYWQIRQVRPGDVVLTTSNFGSFKLSSGGN